MGNNMTRINLQPSLNLSGESGRLFNTRLEEGFWDRFIRPGVVIDVGYKGHTNSTPIFNDAIGLDVDSPGYDGRNIPYQNSSIGTIYTSHLLEHIADYGHFYREAIRVLDTNGTLIIIVPIMEFYERRLTPPSRWNNEHLRFYTASRLCFELESQLSRATYRIVHLHERFEIEDLSLSSDQHSVGPYEIEVVVQKIC
jgi:hypothetical protein